MSVILSRGAGPLIRSSVKKLQESRGLGGGRMSYIARADITFTLPTTANTKSAWTQLFSSTSANASFMRFFTQNAWSGNNGILIDFATGAAGSETAFVSNLAFSGNASVDYTFPVRIPQGVRLSYRLQQSGTTATNFYPTVSLYSSDEYHLMPTSLDVIGTSATTSVGTALSGSNTWTEITSSTTKDYQTCLLVPSAANAGAWANNFPGNTLSLGTGASGSETSVMDQFLYLGSTTAFNFRGGNGFDGQATFGSGPIASGTRLSARYTNTNATRLAFCVVGVPYA